MRPNPFVAIAAATLTLMGYAREWGGPGQLQVFVRYGEGDAYPHVVQLQDAGTPDDVTDSLEEQGVDMPLFFAIIRRVADEED